MTQTSNYFSKNSRNIEVFQALDTSQRETIIFLVASHVKHVNKSRGGDDTQIDKTINLN